MPARYYPITLLLFLSSIILFFVTCSKDTGPVEPIQNSMAGSELTIGSTGGKVEDSYGASISVPAGAISSNLKISVRTLHADSIPSGLQSTVVGNIIECLPHGATFLQPVTIVLPVTSGYTHQPGDSANLYFFNSDSSAWEMTTTPAVVTSDGRHLQALVSHFSNFGTNSSGGFGGGGNSFNNTTNANQLKSKADSWASSFLNKLGGIGAKKRVQDCCMTLANARFEFRFSSPGYTDVYIVTEGEQASCDKTENLNFSEGTPSDGYHMNTSVRLCWVNCNPDFALSVSPSHFYVPDDRGKTADVTAKVTCGSGPGSAFSNQSVKLVVASGPGQVGPPFAKTDASGNARGAYTVDNRGTSTIRAEVQTCQSSEPAPCFATASVLVDTLIPDHIYAVINIRHEGQDMPWSFNDRVEMMLTIEVDDDVVTIKGGEGSHYVTCTSADGDCTVKNLSAPDFTPTGKVTKNDKTLEVEFNPNLAVINFTYYCDYGGGNIISLPVPAYGNMVSSIIAMYLKGTINMEYGSFDQGSGSEDFGEEYPLYFEFEIVYGTKTHP